MIPTNILVPTDFSPCAACALGYACALASKLGAKVHVVHATGAALSELSVTLTDQMIASLRDSSAAALAKLVEPWRTVAGFGELCVVEGDPRDAIVQVAGSVRADLIVIGTHGRRGLSRLFHGSLWEDIQRRAPCPVLPIRWDEHGHSLGMPTDGGAAAYTPGPSARTGT
jgi:nucleotide-binding universal stress UspA family protein